MERHAPLRGVLEACGLVLILIVVSSGLAGVVYPAHGALLCITAVVIAGIRHGLVPALLVSVSSMLVMSYFHLAPHFSFRAQHPEDWVTLASFGLASVLTGNLAERFRRQLEETRAIAAQNELLYSTSRLLAGTFQPEKLAPVLLDAAASVTDQPTVLLLPDGSDELVPANGWASALSSAAREAAEHAYLKMAPAAPGEADGWHFLPLMGARGALGVFGVRVAGGEPTQGADESLDADAIRLLSALCQSAGVALERCRLSEEIRAAQMAAEAERLRTVLLSSVSHDLRTPLASIIGATSTLRDLGDAVRPAEQSELLTMVLEEARRLDRFVGNLLDMTRIGSGKLEPRLAWCDVRDVIAEVVRSLHLQLASGPLDVAIARGFPLLYVDAVLLERVIENLVHNAVKHAGADRPVALTADVDRDVARIRVIDAGPGLDRAAQAARNPLLRRVRDSDRRTAGSGMGLAICYAFTEALGGKLVLLDGAGGRGLCAEIRFPLGTSADATPADASEGGADAADIADGPEPARAPSAARTSEGIRAPGGHAPRKEPTS
jgi:two-component system sensor histidine kinase KdpD